MLPHRILTESSGECVLVAPVLRTAEDDGVADVFEMAQMHIGVFCAVKAVLDRQWSWIKGSFFTSDWLFTQRLRKAQGSL